jgi:ABC-type Fe3+-hydroxamate transport system substrate-binding protein
LATVGFKSALRQGAWIKFDWELLADAKPDAVLWIQGAAADSPIAKSPEKAAEMALVPAVKDLTCVKNQRIYLTNSGSKWLPGSGLVKIYRDLDPIHEVLDR